MRKKRCRGWHPRGLVAVAATVAVLAAGCAAAGKANTERPAGCASPGFTSSQIKLGAIFPNSGASAGTFGAYRAGVDARLGVANATGGVDGRRVTYSWADDRGLASGNLAAAQTLISQQDVFALMEGSTATNGSAAWLHQQGVPVVGTATDKAWSLYGNMFAHTYFVSGGAPVSTWGDYIRAQGARKVALLYSPLNDVSKSLVSQWTKSLQAAGLAVDPVKADPSFSTPDTVAREVSAHGDDALTGITDPGLFAQIAVSLKNSDPNLKVVLAGGFYDRSFLESVGKSLAGIFATYISYVPFEEHAAAENTFLKAMTDYSPQVQPSDNEIALEGWIDTDMMLTGLKVSGDCPTRDTFISGLRRVQAYDAGGLFAPPIDLATNFGQSNRCFTFLKIDPTGTHWDVSRPAPMCGHLL
jgi:ABC-type branched-subunit amino acid transport system substrate-binding protein